MNPRVRFWLGITVGCILAVWVGWDVAEESYRLPALFSLVAICALLVRMANVNLDAIILGLLLVGYLVGNRGFAQFMPFPGLPLLPAEIALAVTGGWLIVKCAFARRLPWRHDALNWTVLAWMLIGTARVLFDLRHYGLLAVRDYAMIYYASFFFIAQALSTEEHSQRFLRRCLMAGGILLPLVYAAYQNFPVFFFRVLTLHGVPLVYYKDDLLETSLAVGAVAIFHLARGRHRYWAWPLAVLVFLHVIGSDSRASMVGALAALVWLVITRRPLFPAIQAAATAIAFAAVIFLATVGENPWARERLEGLNDRVTSLVDTNGQRAYLSSESFDKGDNNRFRRVWWRTVATETLRQAPVCGLGFGYDLAKGFMQTYDPTMGDDFAARSPHSIVMSAFGRMGSIGLAAFLAFVGALVFKTWRTLRDRSTDLAAVGLWCAAWVILMSACFGVVLEGPMGAVVFWSLLGLANGMGTMAKGPDFSNPQPQAAAEADRTEPVGRAGHSD
jgi:hypothetical protein